PGDEQLPCGLMLAGTDERELVIETAAVVLVAPTVMASVWLRPPAAAVTVELTLVVSWLVALPSASVNVTPGVWSEPAVALHATAAPAIGPESPSTTATRSVDPPVDGSETCE